MCSRDWNAAYGSMMNLCSQERMGYTPPTVIITVAEGTEEEEDNG